jgi:hypothetical protein
MARLLSAAARPRSPIHTAVSVFGSLEEADYRPAPGPRPLPFRVLAAIQHSDQTRVAVDHRRVDHVEGREAG